MGILLLCLLLTSKSFAAGGVPSLNEKPQDRGPIEKQDRRPIEKQDFPTINESWYFLFGLDLSGPIHDDSGLEAKVSSILEDLDKYDIQKTFDPDDFTSLHLLAFVTAKALLGIYWPVHSSKIMYGLNVNAFQIQIKDPSGLSLILRQYGTALSMYKFWGANIGSGWFLRGDLGFAAFETKLEGRVKTIKDGPEVRKIYNDLNIRYKGLGSWLGFGYAHSIGKGTRMMWGLNVASRDFDGFVHTVNLNCSLLF